MYGESDAISYLRKAMILELLPGDNTDPEVLGFTYNITSWTPTQIDFKFNWDSPLEISQSDPPERIQVTLTMDQFTDSDGLSLPRQETLVKFIPRQIPSAAEAAAIEDSGSSSETSTAAAGATNFIVSLILAASLN